MRVLHVVGALDARVGGSTTAGVDTAGHLRRLGVEADVAGTWESPSAADYIVASWPELPVRGFPRRPPHHYWRSPALRAWLRAHVVDYDLVCVHGLFKFPFVDAARAAARGGVPYLVQPHSSLDPYDLRKHSQLKALFGPLVVRPMLRRAEGVLLTTDRERARLVTWGADPEAHVLPLPVTAPTALGDGLRFRAAHDIPPDAPIVLFLSRLHRKKGLERLFRAVARLAQQHPDVVLVVAGTGKPTYEAELRRVAEDTAGTARVVWAGHLTGEEKWDAFAAANVFALPSDNENFGIVVLEALLAGTPVVISDEVYLGDELASFGVTVCGSDADATHDALAAVLADPDAARRRTAIAAAQVRDRFEPAAVAARTLDLYERVLGQRAARPDVRT